MNICIEKETEMNMEESRGQIGSIAIWYWLKIYEEGEKHPKIKKVFRDENKAKEAYNSIVAYYKEHGTVDPKNEILHSTSI